MIPAVHPYLASFKRTRHGKEQLDYHRVVAWDDEGRALIAVEKTGELVAADTVTGFAGIEDDFHLVQAVVAATPGWQITYMRAADDRRTELVVAWAYYATGRVVPITVTSDGDVLEADPVDGYKVIPPCNLDQELTR